MANNRVQFQKGLSLQKFFRAYGTEAQCAAALFKWRWPLGFVCTECGHAEGCTELKTRGLLQCRHCRHQTRRILLSLQPPLRPCRDAPSPRCRDCPHAAHALSAAEAG
jgi:hypothetical protein